MRNINEIMQLEDTHRIYQLLTQQKKPFSCDFDELLKQYDPKQHNVMDSTKRKKKRVKVPTDKKDQYGNTLYKEKLVERVRVPIPIQRVIVERAVGFLLAIPVEYKLTDNSDDAEVTKVFDAVVDVFHDNKMKAFDKKLARAIFAEREAAELWYYSLDDNGKPDQLRVRLLSPTRGDRLYPHFDDYDRMDGFARRYTIKDEDGNSEVHFDVYTQKMVYKYVLEASNLRALDTPKLHGFSKIPVVYYRQEEAEWAIVQPVIERIEELVSNWGDTNDYFGMPSYVTKGKVKGFADKGEQGRIYQLDGDSASMDVLSWNNSPESVRNELGNLFNIVFSYTQTPDISFEVMKSLGNNTSGAAIQLMFTDPHMKVNTKTELFEEMFTRRANLVVDGLATSQIVVTDSVRQKVHIAPIFHPFMPENLQEKLQMVATSTGGQPTMSQEEGVKLNPLVKNPEETLKQLQQEAAAAMMADAFSSAQ